MKFSKTVVAVSLCSTLAFANTDSEFLAIIGIEGSIAEKIGFVYKNITPWVNVGEEYDCTIWTPSVSSVDYGDPVLQKQNCSQDQTRNKDYFTVYNSGAEVFEKTETENQTIIVENEKNSFGARNYILNEKEEAWGVWANTGSHYNCDSWSPDRSTFNYGVSFEQNRDCSQNQIRYRDVMDVWADGTETLNRVESGNGVTTEEESQYVLGTKNYEVSTSSSAGSWTNSGGVYSCTSWSPSTGSVNSGTQFTQTRRCYQNQKQLVTTYSHWANGNVTVKSTHYNNNTARPEQSQTATGTKVITGNWVRINSSGTKYGCTSGSGYSGTCSPIGSTVKAWVQNGQSSGTPVCTQATYRCQ